MARRLPPLTSLYAFERAARHASFTLAAQELFVTQGAISRQIRMLEKHLGVELFERGHRSVTLTRAGKAYYDGLAPGFAQIETATGRLMVNRSRQTLVVRAYGTFSTRWLIPRLARFQRTYPKIVVEFTASVQSVDFEHEDVDIAVQFGIPEELPDMEQHLLFPVNILPVCSPSLVRSARPLRHPSDLQHYTLLHTLLRPDDWPNWMKANGIDEEWTSHGYRFESSTMAYEAAIKEIGVALAIAAFVEEDLKEGRLFFPFQTVLATPYAYWLVYPPAKAENPAVVLFRNWMLEEAKDFTKEALPREQTSNWEKAATSGLRHRMIKRT